MEIELDGHEEQTVILVTKAISSTYVDPHPTVYTHSLAYMVYMYIEQCKESIAQ